MRGMSVLVAATLLLSPAAVMATEDPVQTRRALMSANGQADRIGQLMVREEIPFDPQVAELVVRTMRAGAFAAADYFHEGTAGPEANSRASPRIWEERERFDTIFAQFQENAAAAAQARPQDIETFQAHFEQVRESCDTCHEDFRLPRN